MSENELQKLVSTTPAQSYREKLKIIEDYVISKADGVNIIGNGKEIIYPEGLWGYKHSFPEGVYLREMKMQKGQLGFSAIHKHSYGFFLLSGELHVTKEDGIEKLIAPCYFVSPRGAKRIVYSAEECTIVTVHANPTNTQDLDELAEINVVFDWDEYEKYLKDKK